MHDTNTELPSDIPAALLTIFGYYKRTFTSDQVKLQYKSLLLREQRANPLNPKLDAQFVKHCRNLLLKHAEHIEPIPLPFHLLVEGGIYTIKDTACSIHDFSSDNRTFNSHTFIPSEYNTSKQALQIKCTNQLIQKSHILFDHTHTPHTIVFKGFIVTITCECE